MHKVSFWRLRKCVSQNKAKNAGRSRKNAGMREIHQNAGFPARLHLKWKMAEQKVCQVTRMTNTVDKR